jgi:WD40 repeat protein
VLTADATRAAVTIERDASVWMADVMRGTLQRLAADLGPEEPALLFFSPDGRRIAVSARRDDGHREVVWVPTDGVGQTEMLATFDTSVTGIAGGDLSPDGRQLVLTVNKGTADVVAVDVGEPAKFRELLATASGEAYPAISPDGHWLAYTSNDSGMFEVYLQRFPEGGDRVPVSIGGGVSAFWSAGGRALTYLALNGNVATSIARASVGPGTVPTLGSPMDLFPWRYYAASDGRHHLDMTADGERFLAIADGTRSTGGDQLVLVQNWSEELKGLASAKR